MRILKKSFKADSILIVPAKHRTNKSPKPFGRFMHSLHDIAHGFEPNPFKRYVRMEPEPNRATRRAAQFQAAVVLAAADASVSAPVARKLTGAVRRGLAKGKQA